MFSPPAQSTAALPYWITFIRIAQAVFGMIVLALTAYSVSVFSGGGTLSKIFISLYPGFGLAWFAFAWTVLFIPFALFGYQRLPARWRPLIILAVLELLTTLWWLITFALLAKTAGDFAYVSDPSYYDDPSDPSGDPSSSGSGYGYDGYGDYRHKIKRDSVQDYEKKLLASVACVEASASIGALEFVLFVITSAFVIRAVITDRQARKQNMVQGAVQDSAPENVQSKPEAMA